MSYFCFATSFHYSNHQGAPNYTRREGQPVVLIGWVRRSGKKRLRRSHGESIASRRYNLHAFLIHAIPDIREDPFTF